MEATDTTLLPPSQSPPPAATGATGTTSNAATAAQAAAQRPGMTAPTPAPPPAAPPSPHRSHLADIVSAVGAVLGGPKTVTRVDPNTGQPIQAPRSTSQRVAGVAGTLLRGAAAGLGAHPGPGFLGRAAAAGMEEEAGRQKTQFQQTQEEEQAGREQAQAKRQDLLTQASLAKSNQDIARTALDIKATKQAMDEHQVAIANSLQAIANIPGATKLAHFDSNADINNHLDSVGADLSKKYAVDMARNEIRLAPSPQGGFDAYQVPKDWHNMPVAPGTTVHAMSYAADPKTGKPAATMTEHPAPPGMTWGDQQQWEAEQFKTQASFNKSQADVEHEKAETGKVPSEIARTQAETREAIAGAKLKEQQLTETGADSPLVKEIGTGKMAIQRLEYIVARKPEILEAVAKAYPDFDATKLKNYIDTAKDFTSGKTSVQLNAGATALKHLQELDELNTSASHVPHTAAWTRYQNKVDTVSSELAKFYGDATIPAIASIKNTLASTLPGNRHAAITTQAKSMGDKLDSYEQTWHNSAPSAAYQAPMPGIDDTAKKARSALDPDYAQRSAVASRPPNATNEVFAPDGKTVTGHIVNGAYVPLQKQ